MKKTILTDLLLFAAAAVFAQSEYNFQRRSLFEKLPVTSKDIVFLGNSITDGGEWNELLANPRVKNRGISGDRSSWMLDRLDRPARNSMCRASFRSTTRSRNTLPNTAVTTPTSWP